MFLQHFYSLKSSAEDWRCDCFGNFCSAHLKGMSQTVHGFDYGMFHVKKKKKKEPAFLCLHRLFVKTCIGWVAGQQKEILCFPSTYLINELYSLAPSVYLCPSIFWGTLANTVVRSLHIL